MPQLARKVLFAGPLVRLVDVCCREASSARSGEERADAHQLIVVRSGVFVKHAAASLRQDLVAEPMHALLLNREESFRISHPAPGGDDCTVLELSTEAVGDVVGSLKERLRDRPETPFRITHALFTAPMRLELHQLRSGAARDLDPLAQEERLLTLIGQFVAGGYRAHGRPLAPRREETRRVRRELVEQTRFVLSRSAGRAVVAVAPGARGCQLALSSDPGLPHRDRHADSSVSPRAQTGSRARAPDRRRRPFDGHCTRRRVREPQPLRDCFPPGFWYAAERGRAFRRGGGDLKRRRHAASGGMASAPYPWRRGVRS